MLSQEQLRFKSFSAFLTLTVTLLAPGTGLMTLTIPDGTPLQGLVLLSNYSHPEKKLTEDFYHALFHAESATLRLVAPNVSTPLTLAPARSLPARQAIRTNDRAPPPLPSYYV
jgi:hypothetical protein